MTVYKCGHCTGVVIDDICLECKISASISQIINTQTGRTMKYKDMDGNNINLINLCRQEPEWAKNRIEHLTADNENLGDQMKDALLTWCTEKRQLKTQLTAMQKENEELRVKAELGWHEFEQSQHANEQQETHILELNRLHFDKTEKLQAQLTAVQKVVDRVRAAGYSWAAREEFLALDRETKK